MRTALVLGFAAAFIVSFVGLPLRAADEPIDYASISKIKDQGLNQANSQVMEIASWLTDVHGPRLSGSPNIQKAGEWAVAEMKKWGLVNVALEPWDNNRNFTRGWSNDKFYLASVSPQAFPIPGTPSAWTPGTNGLVRGEAILVTETTEAELQKYAGKLKGKFVLGAAPPEVAAWWTPPATRYTVEELDRRETPVTPEFGVTPPGGRGGRGGAPPAGGRQGGAAGAQAPSFNRNTFFLKEGVLAIFSTSARGHGIYTIGGSRTNDPATTLPAITIPAEQYGQIARTLTKGIAVTLEADVKNTFHPNPTMFNVVGEIRGTDKATELVMLGAHFDSWHSSTGATDNAAGSAAMLEAMRILAATKVPLRRTVRIGLWNGEEQGLNGSAEYVAKHFAARGAAPAGAPAGAGGAGAGGAGAGGQRGGGRGGPLEFKPEHAGFSAYFNIDNGTGAIRGVYLQQNDAVAPIFRAWMEPFRTIGMTHLTISNTGGTDHQSFDAVGLPGFQFIQDGVEYNSLTHHYNLDSWERLQPDDMRKNATIAAAFAFLAANREDKLPRKPLPAGGGRGRGGQ
ncbi:MAG TPA: M20/M25/M40 family metallo-hydrolase [Vicinamibacterales bacterium]|nr:M20/M25/M40 family metallo-hydrolase [Vicinamibacterales bacterium]